MTEPNTMQTGLELSRSADIIERMWDFSEKICQAKFIPQSAQGDPASVFFLISTAQELGLRWTHGLRSLYMTPDGKVGLQGDIIMALLLKQGFTVEFPEKTPQRATCRIIRPNGEGSLEWTFSIQDAEKIKRWDKQAGRWVSLAEKHNYKSYPQNMLMWRALANCARFIAADVMGGIYLPEELEEAAEIESAPADAAQSEALPEPGAAASPVGVKKLAPAPETPPKPVVQPEPQAEQDAGNQSEPESEPGPEPEPEPQVEPETEEDRFRRDFNDLAAELGGGNPEVGSKLIGRYFRGYLDIPKGPLPKGFQHYVEALRVLKEGLDATEFLADPMAYGRRMSQWQAHGTSPMDPASKRMEELRWPEDLRELARTVMAKCQQKPEHFVKWIDAPILPGHPLSSFSNNDLRAFFRLYLAALGDAWDLVEIALQKGIALSDLVGEIQKSTQKPLVEWDLPFIQALIQQLKGEGDGPVPGDGFLLP